MSVSSVAIQFTIVDLLSKGVEGVKSRLKSLASASRDVQKSFDKMTSSFKWAAMSGIATREMYRGMRPAIDLAGDLQSEMIGVRAELMGSGKDARALADEMREIKSTAFAVQAWTPFDMTQIVALEKQLVKAGASVQDVTGKTGAAASAALAVYENLDPVRTGEALIGIGTPFKITADKYMELADTISRAASASVVGASEIAETAKYAAGPMAQLGRSNKEMLALSAVMAQVGISGSMAGTSLKNFFLEATKHKIFRDAKGNLVPTIQMVDILRQKLKGMGEAQKSEVLKKLFGEQGMPVAIALLNQGKGSYEEIIDAMDKGVSLQDKLNLSMTGFKNQLTSLKGTFKSTIADLFQPALPVLTSLVSKVNNFVAAIGEASQRKEWLGKAVTGTSAATLGLGTAATLGLGAAGLWHGRKVLKGVGGIKGLLGGAGSDAAGIAKGKAVEAATGVTPVFVTNWPANFGTSDTTAAKSLLDLGRKGKDLLTVGGAMGLGTSAAIVGGTAVATYGAYKGTLAGAEGITGYLQGGEEGSYRKKLFDMMTGKTPVFRHEKATTNNVLKEKAVNTVLSEKATTNNILKEKAVNTVLSEKATTNNILKEKAVNTVLSEKATTNNILKEKAVNTVLSEKAERIIQTEKVIEGKGRNREETAGEVKNYLNIQIDKDGRVFQEGNMKTEIRVNRGSFQ